MCGIAGLILSSGALPPDPGTLSRLIDALQHRGPDGTGHAVVGRVALVHNRLSIIDLVTGDQPFFAGAATLVANGEVYNYRELRAAMPGVSFATNSDCELPLHLWLRDGPDYARALRGMYAIAIHERAQRTVTLTRDPFGIKPLYIAQVAGGMAFASEPQALIAAGLVKPVVRAAAREELLQLQFTTGADTIFEGVQRVLPGETITCSEGNVLDRRRVSHIPDGPAESIDEDDRAAAPRPCADGKRRPAPAQRCAVRHVPVGRDRQCHPDRADGAAEQPAGAGLHRRLRRAGGRR